MTDALVEAVARVLYERTHGGSYYLADECFQKIVRDLSRAALAVVQPEIDRLREEVRRLHDEADHWVSENNRLREAFWIYVREQNGCSNHECAGIDTEKCGCAVEARAALDEAEAEG